MCPIPGLVVSAWRIPMEKNQEELYISNRYKPVIYSVPNDGTADCRYDMLGQKTMVKGIETDRK